MSKKRKTVLLATVAALLLTALMPAVVSFADEPQTIVQPSVKIIGSTIKNDNEFFELSMELDSGTVGFEAAGIVLQYDSGVINPVSWDDEGSVVPMSDRTDWQNTVSIPAVAPKELSGKTALAYQGADNTGYLYLSSEAALPLESLDDNVKRTITIRFRYAGEDEAARLVSKGKIESDFENQAVVKLAPDEIAEASPAGQCFVYYTGVQGEDFYYTPDDANTIGLQLTTLLTNAPEFVLENDADSANTGGGSDVSSFAALVFFDWDEKTLLGSVVVDGSAETEEINAQIRAFNATLLPPDFTLPTANDVDIDAGETLEGKLEEITYYNPDYPLTSHKGYTFGKWIEYDSEDFTVYGNAVDAANGNLVAKDDTPADPDFSSIAGGKILKAAYISNKLLDSLTTASLRRYTLSNDEDTTDGIYDPNDGYFGRFGTSQNYAVRAKVTRVNANNNPVYRARKTAVKAVFYIGSTQINSLTLLENVDEQIVEVAAPAGATRAVLTVVDIGGVSDWVSAPTRSAAFSVLSDDFILQGNVVYLNEWHEGRDISGTFTPPGATYFTAAGLDITTVAGSTVANDRVQAIRNIAACREQKLSDTGKKYLTQAELQNAITYGNYLGSN